MFFSLLLRTILKKKERAKDSVRGFLIFPSVVPVLTVLSAVVNDVAATLQAKR
jgi:hypothetical protein